MKKWALVLSVVMILGLSSVSWATLWDRGGGMIYDDYLKITWLQDANYAATQFVSSGGACVSGKGARGRIFSVAGKFF